MRLLFTAILYLNILVSLISFIFACILLKRSKGNAIYFNFGMAVLFLGTWAAEIFLLFFKGGILLANLSYLFGIWILHYFLLFTYLYPVASPKLRYKFIIFYFFTLLVSTSIFIPKLYTTKAVVDFPYLYFSANPVGVTIFSVYFAFLSVLAFKNLITKYLQSDGIFKKYLFKIILGTGIAIFFNFIFSINIYYFTEFDTTPIGMLFTFSALAYIYSILFSKKI